MTPEQHDKIMQTADLLRQDLQGPYRTARGAEEYALSVCLAKLAELTAIVERCAA